MTKDIFKKKWFFLSVLSLLTLLISIQQYLLGPKNFWNGTYTHYNNYVIFKSSFDHLKAGVDLYVNYPQEYGDLYKYSPTFAWCMAVFDALPDLPGLILWNLLNVLVFAVGLLGMWKKEEKSALFVLLFIIFELILSTQNSQSNALMAGLLMLAYNDLEKEKNGRAAVWLSIGSFVKLYSIAGVLLILLYPGKIRTGLIFLASSVLLFLFPLFSLSLDQLVWQYGNWFHLIQSDSSVSTGMSFYQYAGLLADPAQLKVPILISGGMLLILPFILNLKSSTVDERRDLLSLLLIWLVVFNPKAESPTYIIAMTGVGLWIFGGERSKLKNIFGALTLIFTSLWFTDLIPKAIKQHFIAPELVKPFGPCLIFLTMVAMIFYSRIFSKTEQK